MQIVNQVGFSQFWAVYPRRVGKLAAIREWNRLKPDSVLVNQMLMTIRWQGTSKQWREGYIPHPKTWLHQGRWLDEPDTAVAVEWVCPHVPPCGQTAFRCHQQVQLAEARRTGAV